MLDEETYQAMRKELIAKRDRAKSQWERLQKGLEGLEIAYRSVGGASSEAGGRGGRGQVSLATREVLETVNEEFTTAQVLKLLLETKPDVGAKRSTVNGALKELVDDGTIELIEKGKGRAPSRFRVLTNKDVSKNAMRLAQ